MVLPRLPAHSPPLCPAGAKHKFVASDAAVIAVSQLVEQYITGGVACCMLECCVLHVRDSRCVLLSVSAFVCAVLSVLMPRRHPCG